MEGGLRPRERPRKRFAAGAVAALIACALLLALVWMSRAGGSDWSIQQRSGVQVLVESELPQATRDQQVCVVDYIAGHLSPTDWMAMVRRLSGAFRDAIRVEADASRCAA